jgi:hypothetical protein
MIKDSHKNCINIRVNKGCINFFWEVLKEHSHVSYTQTI